MEMTTMLYYDLNVFIWQCVNEHNCPNVILFEWTLDGGEESERNVDKAR